MVNQSLIKPTSIVVVGASDNTEKPGGKILKNIVDAGYSGQLHVVNAKQSTVQGLVAHRELSSLPPAIDLAVLAIPAADCPTVVDELAAHHQTTAFIIVSAGFSEESEKGRELEAQLVAAVNRVNGCLIGPNCVGLVTPFHSSVFTTPVPKPHPQGADLISASGATAVYIMETGLQMGLRFNHVFSVGNAAQTSVEDVLAYMDEHYDAATQSSVKLLYFESIKHPQMLLTHAQSLVRKGCKLVAIKAGSSQAGKRAAMSHTGSLAGNDQAVEALFDKAGIIRCHSREQMAHIAGILGYTNHIGKNVAIITHAGGPAVMLTDTLEKGGFVIPKIEGKAAEELLAQLYHGASVANPIDVLATGTPDQLGMAIDACENQFGHIDTIAVIFGSSGLFPVNKVYDTIHQKMRSCRKPIIPVLPSVMNAAQAIEEFKEKGHPTFTDEVAVGQALASILNAPTLPTAAAATLTPTDVEPLRRLIASAPDGFLTAEQTNAVLKMAAIPLVPETYVTNPHELADAVKQLGFPLVAKVIGPLHKTEVDGVVTHITAEKELNAVFDRLMAIHGAKGVLLQPQLKGHELFIGAKREPGYGHLILFGLGGIYVETLRDVACVLSPASSDTILGKLKTLRSYPLFEGFRGQAPINQTEFCKIVEHVSALLEACPDIDELDLNPILATNNGFACVDARVGIKKIAPPE